MDYDIEDMAHDAAQIAFDDMYAAMMKAIREVAERKGMDEKSKAFEEFRNRAFEIAGETF